MTDSIPIFYEVHADFTKSGIAIPKSIKWGGKGEPIILEINPQIKRIAYYTRESVLILAAELGSAYHAEPLPGVGNGFIIKFRGLEQSHAGTIHEVDHILSCCNIDSRRERDLLVSLIRTTQSRDGTMSYFLKKYFDYPGKFTRGVEQCKDDDKKPAKVVITAFNTLIFNPPSNPTPRRCLLHETWAIENDPKKATVTCMWHPDSKDPAYKKQLSDWNNKKSKLTIYGESAQQSSAITERAAMGKHFLQGLPRAPASTDALKDEMFEEQRKQLHASTPTTTTTAATQSESLTPAASPYTPQRRETLEQQALTAQHSAQRQRASALQSTTLDSAPLSSTTTTTSTLVSPVPQKTLGKRGTLFAHAKVGTTTTHTPKMMALPEDSAPPPPPMDDDDLPPPPPPSGFTQPTLATTTTSSSTGAPPPPPPMDDDDMPPPPPPGMATFDPDGDEQSGPDDDDDDEPPPPGGIGASKFKSAASHIIIDDIPLQMPPTLTPRSTAPSISIQMDMPPGMDPDMPLQPLPKLSTTRDRSESSSFQREQAHAAAAQLSTPIAPHSNPDVRIDIIEEGDFIKEVRTEIITNPHTGQRQQRVTETITPRVIQQPERGRGMSTVLAATVLAAETPLPPTPCPAGCHYRYTNNNPLTRKCQLLMDDAVLGVLDPNFELPFLSAEGEPVYGVLPDPSCDLPDNYLMTTNGLIVECRVNGTISIDDTIIAQVATETPIHLLGRPIARQGQTLTFLAEGCIPGSETEMEVFLPPEDEEMPPAPPQINVTAAVDNRPLPPTPPPTTPGLSVDLSMSETPLPGTPIFTPSAQPGHAFTFGAAGVELKIFLEGHDDEPIGVIEIPADVDSSHYHFSQLRDQIMDELDDIPEDFCFLLKGARLTAKQEPKRSVATLSEPMVTIRDIKKYEQHKAEEEKKKLEEEERKKRMAAAPQGQAPRPPHGFAPSPPPPGSAPRAPPPGAPRGVPPGSRPTTSPIPGSSSPTIPPPNRPQISMAALQGGASALKKAPIPDDKTKPANLLSQLKDASSSVKLNKVDHDKIRAEKEKRKQRQSVVGNGMFGSIKSAMAQRRQVTAEEIAEDTDSDWD